MDNGDAPVDLARLHAELRQILSEVTGEDLSAVADDASLLDYVASSLALIEGLRRLYDRFGVLIPIRSVFEGGANLGALAAYIVQSLQTRRESAQAVPKARIDDRWRSRLAEPNGSQERVRTRSAEWGKQRMAFLRREAQLPASIAPARGLGFKPQSGGRTVFLTGATGFLGVYIIAEILRTTNLHVYCLVRPRRGECGKWRLEQQLRTYELWQEDELWQFAWHRRVHVVEGDVTLARMGLAGPAYEALARDMDCIIHSAAHVNFVYPYEALRMTNVLGVHEVIRFAFRGQIKPVHYLSTTAVWPMGANCTFYETDPLDHGRLLPLGYAEAKWVGERCLLHAEERGLPLARYRPGEVGGDTHTGRCVLDHLSIESIKGFLQFGAFPALDMYLDVTPVDYVAAALVYLAFLGNPLGRAFHLTNPRPCHLNEAFALLRSLGYRFEECPFEELRDRLLASSDFVHNALFAYHAVLAEMDNTSLQLPNFDCTETLRELEGSGIDCPPVDDKLLGSYLHYLRGIGYMPEAVVHA